MHLAETSQAPRRAGRMARPFTRADRLDEILRLVADGMSIPEACRSNPSFPKPGAVRMQATRSAEFRERLSSAIVAGGKLPRGARRVFSASDFEAALAVISQSDETNVVDILRAAGLPSYAAIFNHAAKHDDFKARFHAAIRNRPGSVYFGEEAYAEALARLNDGGVAAIRRSGNLPVYEAVRTKARREQNFGRQFDVRREERTRRRDERLAAILEHRQRRAPQREAWRLLREARRRVYEKHVLVTALRQNEVYAAAEAAVPKYLQPYDRDDIIAQIVLEVLEDGIALHTVGTIAKDIVSEHFSQSRVSWKMRSLDAPLTSDSSTSLIDTLSNGWES